MCLARRRKKRHDKKRFSGGELDEMTRQNRDGEAQDSIGEDMTELNSQDEPLAPSDDDEQKNQAEQDFAEIAQPEPEQPAKLEPDENKIEEPAKTSNEPNSSDQMNSNLSERFWQYFYPVYQYCYFVGIQLMRFVRHKERRQAVYFQKFEDKALQLFQKSYRFLKRCLRTKYREILTPIRELREKYRAFLAELRCAKSKGTRAQVSVLCRMTGLIGCHLWRGFVFVFNWLAPVLGVFIFLIVIGMYQTQTLALKVEYNGENLGYILDESVFNEAETAMKARIINESYIKPRDIVPKFELSPVSDSQLVTVDELTNKLIRASGNKIEEATGLYIQNRFISAVQDGQGLLDFLNSMLDKYSEPDMDPTTKIQFVKKVEIKKGLYPVSSIQPLGQLKEKLSGEERGEKRYIVEEEDTPIRIAYKAGISLQKLKLMNPGVEENLLIGDSLLISQSVPYMGVKVTKLEQYEEEVEYKIQQETDPKRNIGYTVVKQEGRDGLNQITDEVVMIDGIETERRTVNMESIRKPVDKIIVVGGNKPLQFIPSTASGKVPPRTFGWQAAGGSITTGFLGYYGHTGADISFPGCYGTPVYSSLDGQVVTAGWRGNYGYCVIINHGGGVQTLYAHASKLYVSPGQQVSKGELLAAIGRTGNTTGPHVHFEVRINGTPVNPAPYLYG